LAVPFDLPTVEGRPARDDEAFRFGLQLKGEMSMALNIGSNGNGKPYCKYNAKAGAWFVRGSEGEEKEVKDPSFVADFDNIATGWLRFREGQAPERVMDPSLDRMAPDPGEGFKRGFVLMVYSPKYFGGAAEFASPSILLADAIKDLHAQYVARRGAHPGKLPVIACTGSQAVKTRHGTNYRPTVSIVDWVDRPDDLPGSNPVDVPPLAPPPPPPPPSLSNTVF
jgi:hypothetical protein